MTGAPQSCVDNQRRRTEICVGYIFNFGIRNDQTGQVTGNGTLAILYWQVLNLKSRSWTYDYRIRATVLTDMAATGTSVEPSLVCTDQCQEPPPSGPKPISTGQEIRESKPIASPAPAVSQVGTTFRVIVRNASTKNTAEEQMPQMDVARCDDGKTLGFGAGSGCVYPTVYPTFMLSGVAAPASPMHAAFVARAQQTLPDHWGRRADGKPLHRLFGDAQRNANRAKACAGFKKGPMPGDSCDEFPFASTYESSEFGGTPRAAVEHVPGRDNSAGGTKLAAFNRASRVLDRDAYWIQVVP